MLYTASCRTGGKGTVRRKFKAVHKNAVVDDKKLKSALQKLNLRELPGIEEVNMFSGADNVIHFRAPTVQANIGANTYVINGEGKPKKIHELLPGILSQLGQNNLEGLKKMYEQLQASGAVGGDDDELPNLVDNFDDVKV